MAYRVEEDVKCASNGLDDDGDGFVGAPRYHGCSASCAIRWTKPRDNGDFEFRKLGLR